MSTLCSTEPSEARLVRGPLAGLRVVEFGSIGPAPFAAMMLGDMGADVIRIERCGIADGERAATLRGRRIIELDLKQPGQRDEALALIDRADVVIEGFRPGVMERLGLGPDVVQKRNKRLVYGRMTGWGQYGPLAQTAGHDINYIAITGALHAIGPAQCVPPVPLNLIGDYGGGALFLVSGILAALLESKRSGEGQVVDAAICDGTVSLLSLFYQLQSGGEWTDERQSNALDGAAPFYRVYECKDGRYLAVGALEEKFYLVLRKVGGWADDIFAERDDPARWKELSVRAETVMRTRTREEWMASFSGTDACVAPVLSLLESRAHPHLLARNCHIQIDGQLQPAPAPRFSRTASQARPSTRLRSLEELSQLWRAD